jgi:cytochrome c peroxidase
MDRASRARIVALTLSLAGAAFSQASGDRLAALGEALFSNKGLSSGRTVSCATCHDPAKAFTDAKADSEGEARIGIGRNSPTFWGIASIPRFRDPRQAQDAKPGRTPKVLTLEERCIAPLENELEMGSRAEDAVAALRKDAAVTRAFDEAFGGHEGVSKARIGKALATYVRTLTAPAGGQSGARAAYADLLSGNGAALSDEQQRGLAVFKQRGCAECHSGPALSDGLMHVVDPPWGQRMHDRRRAASERHIELLRREYAAKKTVQEVAAMSLEAIAKEAKLRANTLPGGGGYDAEQIEVQTATLWDVRRTAPYFRDGSVKSLEDAVRAHMNEMRAVADNDARIKKELASVDRAGKRSPTALRATPKYAAMAAAGRAGLSPEDFQDLLGFLDSLSPRAAR